jgi:hypothetical protein
MTRGKRGIPKYKQTTKQQKSKGSGPNQQLSMLAFNDFFYILYPEVIPLGYFSLCIQFGWYSFQQMFVDPLISLTL